MSLSHFESVLKACFQANRKTLFNNLKKTYSVAQIQEFFTQSGLEISARPHQVAPAHYVSLAQFFHNLTHRTTHGKQSL
ncbi:hypothetical protein NHP190003_11520 [Helicobacter sp. NHP19-003]|uniref:Uncharacterized protein n=1 Tax=Helicobacter gastrocanis TaxID=2849641 RepID=A0ABN6I2R7_9HELI|nr:hypothetical protein NHP190003_11520 [Helicobacter sp. NHP19-003]